MFTGIVQDTGIVTGIVKNGDWVLTIKVNQLPLAQTQIGASISCSGICLTVVTKSTDSFTIQASAETLSKTTMKGWQLGTQINLEPALRLGDELGGHLVAGHVDGTTKVTSVRREGDSMRVQFAAPQDLARFFAPKGSVVIDGVSLTVNEVEAGVFGVNLIPHTWNVTTLGKLQSGDAVNVEVDLLARYIDRLLQQRQ